MSGNTFDENYHNQALCANTRYVTAELKKTLCVIMPPNTLTYNVCQITSIVHARFCQTFFFLSTFSI